MAVVATKIVGVFVAAARAVSVVLYTRQGCHLCEEALLLLRLHKKAYHLMIEEIDIDSDPALAAAYGEMVPVIALGKAPSRGLCECGHGCGLS